MAKRYKAVLFAPDGDWVTDFRDSKSPEEVWDKVSDMGSRWVFYPIVFVIVDHGPVTTGRQFTVDGPEEWAFGGDTGRSISSISRLFSQNTAEIVGLLNG